MKKILPTLVTDAHAYTRSRLPWRLDANRKAYGETSTGRRFGWRLFHYLSGGGISAFGRTIQQEEHSYRQSRFLVVAAVLVALEILFWIF